MTTKLGDNFLKASLVTFIVIGSHLCLAQKPMPAESGKNAEASPKKPESIPDPLNYSELSHTISIQMLRAGSHDDSGSSSYFFKAQLLALINTPEERNLPLEKRKKIDLDLGTFGETSLDSLAFWVEDEKKGDIKTLSVDGNVIRELAAKSMRTFQISEADLSMMVEIGMYKKQKKLIFFGDDTKIAASSYYPIPPTKFDVQLRTNQNLLLNDPFGTMVKIAIKYLPAGSSKI